MSERGEAMEESRILSATRRVAEVFVQEVSLRTLARVSSFQPSFIADLLRRPFYPGRRLRFLRGVLCRSRRGSSRHPSSRVDAGMDLLRTSMLEPRSISNASNPHSTSVLPNRFLPWTTPSPLSNGSYHSHLRNLPRRRLFETDVARSPHQAGPEDLSIPVGSRVAARQSAR